MLMEKICSIQIQIAEFEHISHRSRALNESMNKLVDVCDRSRMFTSNPYYDAFDESETRTIC